MVGPATFLAFFVAGPARPPQTCHASRDTSRTAPKEPMPCPSATGPTTVPRSRHHRKQGAFLRPPLRDRTHNGATVPSSQGSSTVAQVSPKAGAGPKKKGSPAPRNCFQCFPMAQVSKRKTDLLRLAGGPAPPGEGTCATGRRDLRQPLGRPAPRTAAWSS